jgi:hypothetical protein
VLHSPTFLMGTADDIVTELKRRQREWGLSEVVFSHSDDAIMERLGREVLPHL